MGRAHWNSCVAITKQNRHMNTHLSQLVYAAALSSGLFLTACSGENCVPCADGVSAMAGVDPIVSSAVVMSAPDTTMTTALDALRDRRLSSFMQAVMPPSEVEAMRKSWSDTKKQDVQGEDAEFQVFMTMATAEGAEETLFMMLKPYLADVQEQVEGLTQMLPFMVGGALSKANVPQETQAKLTEFAQGITDIDFASEEKARRAVKIVVTAARALNVLSAKDLQALSFDEVMGRADVAYAGVLDVLGVYGLSPDAMMKSMSIETVSSEGDLAQMEMTFSLFGMDPETVPFEMERIDGRWFPKKPVEDESSNLGLAR